MSDPATVTIPVELDPREIRSLRYAAALLTECLGDFAAGVTPPDGRLVHPSESALMKLEMALMLAGEEL